MYDSFSLTPYFIITINELQCLDSQRVSISSIIAEQRCSSRPRPAHQPIICTIVQSRAVTVTHPANMEQIQHSNIPYGQSPAKFPDTWSLGHLVTWSLGHSVTRSLGHSVTWSFGHICHFNLSTN